jgi:hypothetical protein
VIGFGLFLAVWATLMLVAVGGLIVGVSALVSVARLPAEAFGPWWDNTKSAWLLGIAVSFVLPFGTLVAGALWFGSGKRTLLQTGTAGRPFWTGPPRPPPASWQRDPWGRHELRYWDGRRWSEHVSDAGNRSLDPTL